MFDTTILTKLGGSVLGALLFFLLGNWVAQGLYFSSTSGHGDGEHAMGYHISTDGAAPVKEAEAEEAPAFVDLLAAADAGKGEKLFGKCKACHKLEEGGKGTGPSLYGVVGREVASVEGFGYSDALMGLGGAWGPEELNGYIENPKAYAPGNKMAFKGLSKPVDRANLIGFLQTVGN